MHTREAVHKRSFSDKKSKIRGRNASKKDAQWNPDSLPHTSVTNNLGDSLTNEGTFNDEELIMISSIAWELDNKNGTFGLKVKRRGQNSFTALQID
jgi:hypothetical protein